MMKDETHLPQDRDKWPISQIENGCFQAICHLLDLHYLSNKEPLLSALGFTQNEATSITQEFMARRGKGMANKALGIWGTSHRKNNVGVLKNIVKRTMRRDDVFCVIKNWEKLPVCHGCGINL
jgi:DNA-nicking Smr family endonuclease